MHASLIWLGVAVALALGEAAAGELFLLMLAGGALGGGAAAGLGAPLWLQALVFALTSVLLIGVVRPYARRRLLAGTPETETNTAALVGRTGRVLEPVGRDSGLVEIGGDVWTARPLFDGEGFAADEPVYVHEIRGATVVVTRAA